METEDVLGSFSSVVRMTTRCGKDNTNIQFLFFLVFVNIVSFNALWKILRLGNSAWDVFGVNFWPTDFFGGFDFCPRSIIPIKVPPPPPVGFTVTRLFTSAFTIELAHRSL